MTHDEILALADAIAPEGGIATGIGTARYGAQLVVLADSRAEAVSKARTSFATAARAANLPDWPVVREDATSEEDELAGE